MHETRTLAEWTANLRLQDIPEDVREHAQRFILDNFGCQIAGATLPWSQIVLRRDQEDAQRHALHGSLFRRQALA